jgi:hypothetical protein
MKTMINDMTLIAIHVTLAGDAVSPLLAETNATNLILT